MRVALGEQPTNAAGRRLKVLMEKHGGIRRVRSPPPHVSSAFGGDCCSCLLLEIWHSAHFATRLTAAQLALNEAQVKAELGLYHGIAYTPHATSPKRRGARKGRATKRCETGGALTCTAHDHMHHAEMHLVAVH